MPEFIHERAKHILAKNPDMPKSEAFGIATLQSHAMGKSPKGYGTTEGRHKAKTRYKKPKSMEHRANPGKLTTKKLAFVEALPVITGLASGYSPGREIAGQTAAATAPAGRVTRSDRMARNLAMIGVPIGGLGAMMLSHKYSLPSRLAELSSTHFPKGLIADPHAEKELIQTLVPGAAAISGSLAGGALTGGLIGGLQQLRGPKSHLKTAADESAAQPQRMAKPTRVPGAGGLAVKSMLGSYASALGGLGLGLHMQKQVEKEKALAGAGEMYDKVLSTSPVPVHQSSMVNGGGFFVPKNAPGTKMQHMAWGLNKLSPEEMLNPHVVVGGEKVPSVLAHELGHAGIDKSRLGKLVQNVPTMMAGKFAPTLGFAGGLATGGSENERTRNLGMASGLIASLPMLGYEAGASIKGYRNLKRLGATAEQLAHARGTLLPAFGTYAAQAGGALASGALGSAIGRAWGNGKRRREAAEELRAQRMAAKHATVNAVEKEDEELGDENEPHTTKSAFNTNMYSGVMNPAPMKYESGIPSWSEPPVKTAGPPSERKEPTGRLKSASEVTQLEEEAAHGGQLNRLALPVIHAVEDARPFLVSKLKTMHGQQDKEASVRSPQAQLATTQTVGAPKLSTPPGPSIAQISKPRGYGRPISGAAKGNDAI